MPATPDGLFTLLLQAVALHASDLHLSAGRPPMARVMGALVPLGNDQARDGTASAMHALTHEVLRGMLTDLMNEDQHAQFMQGHEVDFAFSVPRLGRFRGNAFVHQHGCGAVLRHIPSHTPSLAELHAPAVVTELLQRTGLLLVTGPTGSGKSTTLAAMIGHRNAHSQGHIITIEDPIEYHLPGITQTQTDSEKGYTFLEGLRSALRQDPDVIVVGEIRDDVTAKLAFQSALTGHLVISTIHSEDSASVYARLSQLGVPKDLCNSLILLISQRLLSLRDFSYSTPVTGSKDVSGYKPRRIQRVGVFEVIPVVDTQKVTLFQNTFPEYIRRSLQKQGVLLLEDRIREISNTHSNLYMHG